MNKYLQLKDKFDKSEKIVGATMMLFDNTYILEEMAKRDLDFILFDTEHGVFDTHSLMPSLQVMRLMGVPSIVRVQDSEYHLVAKVMDMGADGVMIPRCETLEQVQRCIDGLLFYPDGRKGIGGHGQMRRDEGFSDYIETRFLLPQIESPLGVENLPAMLEKYGQYISAVIVGPNDMAIMVGTPCENKSKQTENQVQKVFDICKRYGKSVGIFCADECDAALYRKMGANVLWLGLDKGYFLRGFNEMLDGVDGL